MMLAGCATTPYIDNPRPDAVDGRTRLTDPTLKRGSIDYAVALADNTIDAYQDKLVEEARRQQKLSSGLLTLGTALVGAATGGAHRDVFVVGALGGGLAYQLGTWNSSAERLNIYLEGMLALSCAKAAIAPLRWSPAHAAEVQRLIEGGYDGLNRAADAVSDVTAWLAVAGAAQTESALVTAAQAELKQSATLFAQGNELMGRASAVAGRVDGAGALLEHHVETVQRQISEALKGTLADLKQLPAQVNAISQYANVFAPGLQFDAALGKRVDAFNGTLAQRGGREDKSNAPSGTQEAELARALGTLRSASLKLAPRLAQLQGALDRAATAQVADELQRCGVDPEKLKSQLRLDRSSVTFTAGSAQSTLVAAAGGTSPYAASVLDSPHEGVAVEVLAGTDQVRVSVAAGVAGGQSFSARVADSRGQRVNLSIQVDAAPEKKPATSTAAKGHAARPAAPAACAQTGLLTQTQVCLVQKQLAAYITGQVDNATCKALQASTFGASGKLDAAAWRLIAQTAGLTETSTEQQIQAQMDPTEVTACKTGPPRKGVPRVMTAPQGAVAALPATVTAAPSTGTTGPRTEFERQLSADQIRQRRIQLQLPGEPPVLDDAFRDALSRKQRELGMTQTTGSLDPDTLRRLDGMAAPR